MLRPIVVMALGAAVLGSALAQEPGSETVRERMAGAAAALAASVEGGPGPVEAMIGLDKAASLKLPLDDPERRNWQFWPTQRVGLELALMSADQRRLAHELLTSVLSSQGYLKVAHIMQLERILGMMDEGGLPRSVGHYKLVLFGEPASDAAWAWRFEGHHVSLSVAVSPDGVAVTPSFFGSNPAEVRSGPLTGLRVLGEQEDLARELVDSLQGSQRERAIVSDRAPAEIFTANIRKPREEWDAWKTSLEPAGLPVAEMNEVQQHWVQRIVDEAIGNYRGEIAAAYAAQVDLEALHFAWMGSTERGQPHYYRLQGPEFVFEYDNVQNGGNHVHSVWRDAAGDFGEEVLEQHYRAAAH